MSKREIFNGIFEYQGGATVYKPWDLERYRRDIRGY
jgi:hypothetical protein